MPKKTVINDCITHCQGSYTMHLVTAYHHFLSLPFAPPPPPPSIYSTRTLHTSSIHLIAGCQRLSRHTPDLRVKIDPRKEKKRNTEKRRKRQKKNKQNENDAQRSSNRPRRQTLGGQEYDIEQSYRCHVQSWWVAPTSLLKKLNVPILQQLNS